MSNTDNFIKASTNGQTPVVATLTNTHTQGSEAFECDNLTGWADTVAFIVYEIDTNGEPVNGSETSWVAEKNNKILQNAVCTSGADRDYPAIKTVVVADYTAEAHNRLIEALLKTHNQDGAFRDNIVEGKHIRDNAVTEHKLANGAVTGSKIKDGSVKLNHLDKSSFSTANTGYIFNDVAYNSSEYGDLAGSIGPSVKVNVPSSGSVLVLISCGCYGTGVGPKMVSFVASGANTIIVNDDEAARNDGISAVIASSHTILKNLNPGETTFTLKYKGFNSRFFARKITVIPLI